MAIGLHKLTAGAGYTYLTRQVAAHDRAGGAPTPLATYYAERGETPGRWTGRGLAGVHGLDDGDDVTAEQMQALFGHGLHPLAHAIRERLVGPDLTDRDYAAATRLGTPFLVYGNDVTPYQVEVARRIARATAEAESIPDPHALASRIRTEVAAEVFHADRGRDPANARELSAAIARLSRPRTTAIAGFDLTFSPVKSVSALWAIAPKALAAQIEQAHHDAVRDALTYLEDHVLYSREGKGGVRQVDVTGVVATAFVHRDSRAGDPDLHTHVAIANKVQTLAGKWLAIDGRLIYQARVAVSETYTTSLEAHLRSRLGVQFSERAHADLSKRPIREVAGVPHDLIRRWSTRRASIVVRSRELEATFQREHGRPPTSAESIHLAQVATLQTRDAKHEPRTLDEQRNTWAAQAAEALGGEAGVGEVVTRALRSNHDVARAEIDAAWVRSAATTVRATVERTRSTWQMWHVRAEAHRHVRSVNAGPSLVESLVDQVTAQVLATESIQITRTEDGISDPATLRRQDGSSVYTVAGSTIYTSQTVIDAEQRILAEAGSTDRPRATEDAISLALLEQAANGIRLNAAQVALVRSLSTSGRRVQLALAPAGSGKTTAMAALASAWTGSGGTVIGLAPSAAAAAVLRDHIGATTDTLAKLTWSIEHDDLPTWAAAIGPATLAIIDEAGLADTLTLDAAIAFITGRGGQVRLIGDQHQLSPIGAGGVLRDIAATHGAVQLTELVRFIDPAEGAASLALREGRHEALGFYLDNQRVHVGGLASIADDAFTAWSADQRQGLNSLMIAPTRDLIRDLNLRAQHHRIGIAAPGPGAPLADGTTAYLGDRVISRRNNRRLPTSPTDWVKNGDQWTVQQVQPNGSLNVTHLSTNRQVFLPPDYVERFVELGYATTIHGAQGLSVDTMHGLATGTEHRQQLYTMLTRGALENHVYVQTVGDSDPHTVIRPEHTHPPTATDILEQILNRDGQPDSATTLLGAQVDPAARLAHATARYTDALHHAAEQLCTPAGLALLDANAERALPGITDEQAWPTLRGHLCLIAAAGTDPAHALQAAAALREVDTAEDRAAVLDWRLDDSALNQNAPLPWLPGIPSTLSNHPDWGPYLNARADITVDLAKQVAAHADTAAGQQNWSTRRGPTPPDIVRDIAVWRAAHGIDDAEHLPTGPRQLHRREALWQAALQTRLGLSTSPAVAEWILRLHHVVPATIGDPYAARLAEQLCDISRAGIDAHALLDTSAAAPLPDDHPAAALWWRISRHITPATTSDLTRTSTLNPSWTTALRHAIGDTRSEELQGSRWWPALVTATDHAIAQGMSLDDVLSLAGTHDVAADLDACQGLVWRLSLLTDPTPPQDVEQPEPCNPDETWFPPEEKMAPLADAVGPDSTELARLMLARKGMGVLDRSNAEIEHEVARAAAWDDAPFTPHRAAQINAMARDFYKAQLDGSWAHPYLCQRLHTDTPPGDAGYAPFGWTNVTDHLRRHGISDDELLAVGISSVARTGRLIDRFRDRLILPIEADGQVLGFIARRHPRADDSAGPKYLNTSTTALFHKGDVLYGHDQLRRNVSATPVLVEGPLDALAVNHAGHGQYIGVAALGTGLTQTQARHLASAYGTPIVATDNDGAGRAASERAFWLLAQHGAAPEAVDLPPGADPCEILMTKGPAALAQLLKAAKPMAKALLGMPHSVGGSAAHDYTTLVIAASPPEHWAQLIHDAALAIEVPPEALASSLATTAQAWVRDPRRAAARVNERQARSERPAVPAHRPEATGHTQYVSPPAWRPLAAHPSTRR